MKTQITLLVTIALLASLSLAAACGGDGGGGIRIQKGLSVAALAAGAGQDSEATDGLGGDDGLIAGAPSSDADIGIERGGAIAPDIAPFPGPSLQESQTGITVQGFGSASVDADSAVLDLYFGREFIDDIMPMPEPGFEGGEAPSLPDLLPPPEEITEADLQPVVDAIAAQGVSRADIEVIIDEVTVDLFYDEPFFGGSATIRVTVRNVDALEDIVDAASEAASDLEDISFQGSSASYTASDCAGLEEAAMEAAVDDARQRGQSFASALGVGLGAVAGASHSSSYPFGSPCDSGLGDPYRLDGIAYAEGQSPEVQIIATVTVTYAIQ